MAADQGMDGEARAERSGESMYHVWRRSDGYVSCSKGKKAPQSNGRDTFDVLLSTLDWPEAQARIEAERDAKHFAVVESWGAESGRNGQVTQ